MRCPGCGRAVPPGGFRFCGTCGETLDGRPSRADSRPAPDASRATDPSTPRSDPEHAEEPDELVERPVPTRTGVRLSVAAVVLALVAVGGGVVLLSGGTPTVSSYGGEGVVGRAGSFPGSAARGLDPRWRVTASAETPSPWSWIEGLEIAGRTVLVAADLGLLGLDRDSGELLWRYELGSHPGGVALDGEGPAVVAGWRRIAGVDPTTGRELWRREVDGSISLAGVRNGLAIGVHHGEVSARLVALDVADGSERWSAEVPAEVSPLARPLLTDDVVVIMTLHRSVHEGAARGSRYGMWEEADDGPLLAFGLTDGRTLWRRSDVRGGTDRITTTPDTIVVASVGETQELRALDAFTGEQRWSYPLDGRLSEPPAMSFSDGALAVYVRGELRIIDPAGGTVLSVHPVGRDQGSVTLGRDIALVWSAPFIRGVRLSDGEELWIQDGTTSQVREVRVLGDDVVLLGARMVVLDGGSGRERWSLDVGHRGACDLAVADGLVVVGDAGGVTTMDAGSGERWREERTEDAGHDIPLFAVDSEERLFVLAPSERGAMSLRASDVAGQRWEVPIAGRPRGVSAGAHVYLVAEGRTPVRAPDSGDSDPTTELTARDPDDGSLVWSVPLDGWSHDAPLTVGGLVIATVDEDLVAFDEGSGARLWRVEDAHEGTLAVGDGATIVLPQAHFLHAVDTTDGSRRWTVDLGSEVVARPAIAGGTVLVPLEGELVALAAADGGQRWRVPLDSVVHGGISVAGRTIHLATARGLELRDLRDGSLIDETATDRLVVSRPLLVSGNVVVCHADGTVAAYG